MGDPFQPRAGVDYPRTFQEFDEWFATEAGCRDYLVRLRWPTGFRCHCDARDEPWVTARNCLRCKGCRGEVSITAGTLFAGTRKSLRAWFLAIWFVTSQKHGASALGLQHVLGLGSYQTAWTWLHKVRRAMVFAGRDRLSGAVKRGRAMGRVRLQRIQDASAGQIIPFIQKSISEGASIITDGWRGYAGLKSLGYEHTTRNIKRSGVPAHELLPRVHRVASLLKRWFLGTLQGGVQRRHLDYYLDEFTFRFNRRTSRSRGLLFYRLMQQAATTDSVSYRRLLGGTEAPNHNI